MSGNNLAQPTLEEEEFFEADATADYRNEPFTAKITGYKLADAKTKGEDYKRVVRFSFDDGGADLDFMIPKDKEGQFFAFNQIPGFYDLGRLIKALKQRGIKIFFTKAYTKMMISPSIVGATVSFGIKMSDDSKSGGAIPDEHDGDGETKKKGFRNWYLADYIAPDGKQVSTAPSNSTPGPGIPPAPAQAQAAPEEPEVTLQVTKDLIYSILTEIGSRDAGIYTPVNRIQTAMVEKLSANKPADGDKEALAAFKRMKEAYGSHRNAAVAALLEEGLIKQDTTGGNLYRIV